MNYEQKCHNGFESRIWLPISIQFFCLYVVDVKVFSSTESTQFALP